MHGTRRRRPPGPGIRPLRGGSRRAALRGVQDQGRAAVALFLQRRPVRRRRQARRAWRNSMHARLLASGIAFDMLFGPAYKGITLAAAVAIELARLGRNVPFAYNRKEAKDHGEGGTLVGAPVRGRVAHRRRRHLRRHLGARIDRADPAAGATPCGVAMALDRQEKAAENGRDADPGRRCRTCANWACRWRRLPPWMTLLQYLAQQRPVAAGTSAAPCRLTANATESECDASGLLSPIRRPCARNPLGGCAGWLLAALAGRQWRIPPRAGAPATGAGIYTCIDDRGPPAHVRPADRRLRGQGAARPQQRRLGARRACRPR
jgi:hypothetical protein